MSDLLSELFRNVPTPWEKPEVTRGKEIPKDYVFDLKGPTLDPLEWMANWHIPFKYKPRSEMGSERLGEGSYAAALFRHKELHGTHHEAQIWLCKDYDMKRGGEGWWAVWHEIGHACDYVATREGRLIATPHGMYSTKNIEVLRKYQEEIIRWSPHSNREYKTDPGELWAECVACAVGGDKADMPPELLAALLPDLTERNIPVGSFPPPGTRVPEATALAPHPDSMKAEGGGSPYLQAIRALAALRGFIGRSQLCAIEHCLRGEEGEYFADMLTRLAAHVAAMPATYETKEQPDAKAQLHYFGGRLGWDWYIIEKDKGSPDDTPEQFQSQAFGLVKGFETELGYISLPEVLESGAELDLHWTPTPISQLK